MDPTDPGDAGRWEKKETGHLSSVEGKWLDRRDLVPCSSSEPYTGLSFDHVLPASWSAAAQIGELGTGRLRTSTRMLRELAVQSRSLLYSFSPTGVAVFSKVIVSNSLFGAHLCNFQSNGPVTCLPASHKGNHSTENTMALRACFLYYTQHTLAWVAWCIPTL